MNELLLIVNFPVGKKQEYNCLNSILSMNARPQGDKFLQGVLTASNLTEFTPKVFPPIVYSNIDVNYNV